MYYRTWNIKHVQSLRSGIDIGLILIFTSAALFIMATMTLSCKSVTKPDDSRVDFGAELTGFDVETMTGKNVMFEANLLGSNSNYYQMMILNFSVAHCMRIKSS